MAIAACVLLGGRSADAQMPPPSIPETARPPVLDELLRDAPLRDALTATDFRQREPNVMVIPFKSLRLSPASDGTWGVALSRVIPRNSEQSFWPSVTRRIEGLAQQFAAVEKPRRATGGRNIQLIPYAASSSGRYLDQAARRFTTSRVARSGVDAKVVFRDAVTVDVAVNPDFSQVESDQPQVAIDQRFELFYPEKRPFFLENASLFKYVRTAPSDPTTRNVPDMLLTQPSIGHCGMHSRMNVIASPGPHPNGR